MFARHPRRRRGLHRRIGKSNLEDNQSKVAPITLGERGTRGTLPFGKRGRRGRGRLSQTPPRRFSRGRRSRGKFPSQPAIERKTDSQQQSKMYIDQFVKNDPARNTIYSAAPSRGLMENSRFSASPSPPQQDPSVILTRNSPQQNRKPVLRREYPRSLPKPSKFLTESNPRQGFTTSRNACTPSESSSSSHEKIDTQSKQAGRSNRSRSPFSTNASRTSWKPSPPRKETPCRSTQINAQDRQRTSTAPSPVRDEPGEGHSPQTTKESNIKFNQSSVGSEKRQRSNSPFPNQFSQRPKFQARRRPNQIPESRRDSTSPSLNQRQHVPERNFGFQSERAVSHANEPSSTLSKNVGGAIGWYNEIQSTSDDSESVAESEYSSDKERSFHDEDWLESIAPTLHKKAVVSASFHRARPPPHIHVTRRNNIRDTPESSPDSESYRYEDNFPTVLEDYRSKQRSTTETIFEQESDSTGMRTTMSTDWETQLSPGTDFGPSEAELDCNFDGPFFQTECVNTTKWHGYHDVECFRLFSDVANSEKDAARMANWISFTLQPQLSLPNPKLTKLKPKKVFWCVIINRRDTTGRAEFVLRKQGPLVLIPHEFRHSYVGYMGKPIQLAKKRFRDASCDWINADDLSQKGIGDDRRLGILQFSGTQATRKNLLSDTLCRIAEANSKMHLNKIQVLLPLAIDVPRFILERCKYMGVEIDDCKTESKIVPLFRTITLNGEKALEVLKLMGSDLYEGRYDFDNNPYTLQPDLEHINIKFRGIQNFAHGWCAIHFISNIAYRTNAFGSRREAACAANYLTQRFQVFTPLPNSPLPSKYPESLCWSTYFEGIDGEKRYGGVLIVVSRDIAARFAAADFSQVKAKFPQASLEMDPLELLENQSADKTFLYLHFPRNDQKLFYSMTLGQLVLNCGMKIFSFELLVADDVKKKMPDGLNWKLTKRGNVNEIKVIDGSCSKLLQGYWHVQVKVNMGREAKALEELHREFYHGTLHGTPFMF